MALPLKSGADLYNHELLRARLQNLGAQPNTADVGLGQVYFNTGSDTAASKRIGYCYETGSVPQFHHLANLEDISRLEELINELGEVSGGNISEVLTKVNALDEKVTAFLDGTADSDAVLENLKEIQEFLDNYDAEVSLSEQLNDLSDAIDDVANRATKVSVSQTLASGKEIGSITVDGTATTLYAPDDYLPLSGGTLASNIWGGLLVLKANGTSGQMLTFANTNGILGHIGVSATSYPYFADANKTIYTLLHVGNFNTYAPTLTGTGASGTWGIDISGSAKALRYYTNPTTDVFADYVNLYATGLSVVINYSGASVGDIGAYESVLNVGFGTSRFGRFIFNRASYSDLLYWQSANDGADGWGLRRRIAFMDSTVKAATKLQDDTAYTAWGQTFFENGKPKEIGYAKTIYLGPSNGLSWNIGENVVANVVTGTSGNFILGGGGAALGYNTYLDGNNIYLRYGTSRYNGLILNSKGNITIGNNDIASNTWKLYVDGYLGVKNNYGIWTYLADGTSIAQMLGINSGNVFYVGSQALVNNSVETRLVGSKISLYTSEEPSVIINSSGNVTIGNGDKAGTNYKLYVDAGRVRFASVAGEAPALGTMSNMAVAVGLDTYGMQSYVLGNGSAHIQVGRFDGNAFAYPLYLNPLGGNVGIGTTDAQARLHVAGDILLRNYDSIMFFKSDGTTRVDSLTLNSDNEIVLGRGANHHSMHTIVQGYRTIIKTGTDNTNALIIYEDCKASFTSRLLVGTPPDDETVMLNVNGTIRARSIESGSWVYTHITHLGVTIVRNSELYRGPYIGGLDCDRGYIAGVQSNLDDESWYFYGGRTSTTAAITVRDNFVGIGTPSPSEKLHVVGNLYVTGNIIADGEVSVGGETVVGGSGLERVTFTIPSGSTTFDCAHNLDTREITVAIYEEGNDYQQVLADVYLDDVNTARIVFGSATDVVHKVVIIG